MKGLHKNQYNNPRLNSGVVLNEKVKEVQEVIEMLENSLKYAKIKLEQIKKDSYV